ncbi:MAG: radical SAM protein [Betaproteobacteria bacterium]|nr:radical SAM protein [Betaproteobacteria bacterium]
MSVLEIAAGIEGFESLRFDVDLLRRFETLPPARGIRFHTPSFKSYASPEIVSPAGNEWPAVSITGAECKLQCDHCRGRILASMIPARSAEELWRLAQQLRLRGAKGMLLSGGANHRDEVEYLPYLATVRKIRDAYPDFRIAMHTGLVDDRTAHAIEAAGVEVAMLDVIGAQDTVSQVYHLRRPVEDFARSLECLLATSLRVVPHIVLGLHYGRMLGEWHALEMVARHKPAALVLVAAMPIYASPQRPYASLSAREIGKFFVDARRALPETPILLGCARPAGRARAEIDAYAVMAGLSGIAHPSEGAVELAFALGREVTLSSACCSIALVGETSAQQDESVPRVEPRLLARVKRPIERIPVVAV